MSPTPSLHPLKILGAPGSPYSRKLRAVLRFRRIPHLWIQRGSRDEGEVPEIPVQLMPVLVFPGPEGRYDQAAIDSTPLIRRLEREHTGRTVIPHDPVLAFLDALLEDYAYEWLTKCMFHYRWAFGADVEFASRVLPRWGGIDKSDAEIASLAKFFSERQIGRLGVVGSNATTAPVIESSYRRLLQRLDARLAESVFVFGRRPAASDFGLFGQLTQLVQFDPTPMAIARAEAPRIVAWLDLVEDLSGLGERDEDWMPRDPFPETLRALFGEVGRVYAPFLLANARALETGADRVECEIDGLPWVQQPFPYQGKCLQALRAERAGLASVERRAVDALLADTGCEALFA
jgi:glutathione S-transferase